MVVRFRRGALLFALAALAAFAPLPASSQVGLPEDGEVIDGDWVIRGAETRRDTTVYVRGNVTIESGGSLELRHARLLLGQPSDSWRLGGFEVKRGGTFRMFATDAGPSAVTSNETEIRYRVNGTFESRGTATHRNLIEWVWGELGYDPGREELVPLFPDGGSRSGIRFDGGAVGTLSYTDIQHVSVRHVIVADAAVTMDHVALKPNDPARTHMKVVMQALTAARSSQVTLRHSTVGPAHTALYVISAEKVVVEDSRLEGGLALGGAGNNPAAVYARRGDVTFRASVLKAPANVVLLESNVTLLVEDSAIQDYSNVGVTALGLKSTSAFPGTADITLRRVTFRPAASTMTQNGVQTIFANRLVVEDSTLSHHRGNGVAAINTTTVLRNSELRGNAEWGAWLHGGVLETEENNDYGSGANVNKFGRVSKDLTLYVRVLDAQGRPLSNATVKAFDRTGKEAFSDTTRGPNPKDPRGAEKEGWLMDPHYLVAFQRLNDGTHDNRLPYTLEASKAGHPTKTVVLDDLRWQRLGIVLAGASGATEPLVGGESLQNPFAPEEGWVDPHGHDHGDHGSGAHRLLDKVPGPGFVLAAFAVALALALRKRNR